MALKKGFFKGLQGGVNHSPLRMHDGGPPHSKKDFKGLLSHKLATKEPVVDERLLNQSTSDNLAVNNFRINNNISSEKLKNDAAQIKEIADLKNFKERPMLSQGPVTEREKEQAAKNQERGEKIHNASLSLLERPLAYMSDPSALLGDMGINSFLGFDTGNTTQLARDIKTMETDPNLSTFDKLKAKTEMGLGMVPSATVNVGLGMIGAGGMGAGLKGTTKYAGNVLNNTLNPLAGFGKPTINAVSNALGKNADDVGLDSMQEAINKYYGTVNKKYNTANVSPSSTNLSPEDVGMNESILPNRSTGGFGRPNNDIDLGNQLKPLVDELSSYAPTNKAIRNQTLKNMSSPQGQERLVNNILEEMNAGSLDHLQVNVKRPEIGTRNFFTEKLGFGGTTEIAKMTPDQKLEYAKKIAKEKVKEIGESTSVNENLLSSYNTDGSYNPNKAVKALYGDNVGSGNSVGITSFDNASYAGEMSMNPNKKVVWGLGTNSNNPMTAAHELVGHGGQEFKGLGLNQSSLMSKNSGLDQRLLKLDQVTPIEGSGAQVNQNYFNTGSASEFGEYNSRTGRYSVRESEPRAFLSEFRQGMKEYDFLKNADGTWETATPQKIKDFSNYLKANPSGTMKGGDFSPNIRIHDIIDFDNPKNLDEISNELNKMIGQNNPGDADGKNKFNMLKSNSMEANA